MPFSQYFDGKAGRTVGSVVLQYMFISSSCLLIFSGSFAYSWRYFGFTLEVFLSVCGSPFAVVGVGGTAFINMFLTIFCSILCFWFELALIVFSSLFLCFARLAACGIVYCGVCAYNYVYPKMF
jgi:hypothetical protein